MRRLLLILCCAPTLVFADSDFGRLFTTPAERVNLDELRQAEQVPIAIVPPSDDEDFTPRAEALPAISLQGYVKRSDGGKGTVWINQQPIRENSSSADVQVGKLSGHGNRVPLKVPGLGKSLHLKAGQMYLPETDRVLESPAQADPAASGDVHAWPADQ